MTCGTPLQSLSLELFTQKEVYKDGQGIAKLLSNKFVINLQDN